MDFHSQLRQQFKQFKHSQQNYVEILQNELSLLEQYLRQALGLDKCYKKSVTDSIATEPYLRLSKKVACSVESEFPQAHFEIVVVLDDGEETYPKEYVHQSFDLAFVQSDRLVITFFPPTKANFIVNLGDDLDCKFSHFAEAYKQCLLHKLRER